MLIFHNHPLVAAILAWFIAQLIKLVTSIIRTRQFDVTKLLASGGMPSSHASTVTALATSIGLRDGIASTTFALSVVFAIIVMYDASGVRLAVSKQAKLLNDFFHGKTKDYTLLNELVGHTPYQVVMGAILGVIIGILYR